MSNTNPRGNPIEDSDDDIRIPRVDGAAHDKIAKLITRIAVVEQKHETVSRDIAEIKSSSAKQNESLSKMEVAMAGMQPKIDHILSKLDNGGQSSANWVRFAIQVLLTIAAVLVAVYAASKK